jgi:succinoglycan biosynthesis transport protein ExoP
MLAPRVPSQTGPPSAESSLVPSVTTRPLPWRDVGGQYHPSFRGPTSSGSMLLDSLATIKRRWKPIFLFALGGLLAAALATLPQTPKYKAFCLLEVRSLNNEFMDLKAMDPTTAGGGDSAETEVQTQVRIIESQPVTIRTMERMKVYTKDRQSETQSYFSTMLTKFGVGGPNEVSSRSLLKDVAGETKVRSVGATRIVQITSNSSDPFIAQLYVNTLADEYRAQTAAAIQINSSATSEWLTNQLEALRAHLDKAHQDLERYAAKNSLMFLQSTSDGSGPSISQQELQGLQTDLAKATTERISKQAAVEQMAVQNPDSLPPILDNGPIRDYELKLADLHRQLAELSSTLKPTHPKAIRVQNQINELDATMRREKSNVLGRMKAEYESARRRETLLAKAYETQSNIVGGQQAQLVRYNSLRSEVASSQQLYEAMQRKVTESRIAAALHANPIRVVNPAMLPDEPFSPNWLLNTFGGLTAGLAVGLCIAFMQDGTDNRIRMPGQASRQWAVPELGSIPSTSPFALQRFSGQPGMRAKRNSVDNTREQALIKESFRSVVQSILFAGAKGHPIRMITVTSPDAGDGKSSVVSNLARSLSELNKSVLLIDCDLRLPSLHKTFGFENDTGISELLTSVDPVNEQLLEFYIRATTLPSVWLMTAGPTPESIPRVLTSDRMQRLLRLARDRFDMVIIDSPPLLQGADARVLGRLADGLVLVLRAGKTTFNSGSTVVETLHHDEIAILGVVLNGWNPKESYYYSPYRNASGHA